jgi:hypothetical protein
MLSGVSLPWIFAIVGSVLLIIALLYTFFYVGQRNKQIGTPRVPDELRRYSTRTQRGGDDDPVQP